MSDAEQIIKARLDGTFTRWNQETGRIETEQVPVDYKPYWRWGRQCNPANTLNGYKGGTVRAAHFRKSWSTAEDERLMSMYAMDHGSRFIAKSLMRSRTAVEYRIRCLRETNP
jgi:hypothetical protein